jgi:hypothetical protein
MVNIAQGGGVFPGGPQGYPQQPDPNQGNLPNFAPAESQLAPGIINELQNLPSTKAGQQAQVQKPAQAPETQNIMNDSAAAAEDRGEDVPTGVAGGANQGLMHVLGGQTSGEGEAEPSGGESAFKQWWGSEEMQIQRSALMERIGTTFAAMVPLSGGDHAAAGQILSRNSGSTARATQRHHMGKFRNQLEARIETEKSKGADADQDKIQEWQAAAMDPLGYWRRRDDSSDLLERLAFGQAMHDYTHPKDHLAYGRATMAAMTPEARKLLREQAGIDDWASDLNFSIGPTNAAKVIMALTTNGDIGQGIGPGEVNDETDSEGVFMWTWRKIQALAEYFGLKADAKANGEVNANPTFEDELSANLSAGARVEKQMTDKLKGATPVDDPTSVSAGTALSVGSGSSEPRGLMQGLREGILGIGN